MLQQLRVQNLAIVEEACVRFGDGLNVITGETGAGKSVLIGALDLVLGGRAGKNVIRSGATEARSEAVFCLARSEPVDALLTELGLPPCEDGQLIVRRTIAAVGSGCCLVNDATVSVQTLRRLGTLLVDIHGPYEHQSLLNPDFQLDLLDAFGHCEAPRRTYAAAFQELGTRRRELAELQADSADPTAEIDRLQFVIEEIAAAQLSATDEAGLLQSHAEAANAEAILHSGATVTAALTENDGSAFDVLAGVQQQLSDLAHLLPEAEAWRSEIRQTTVQIQELAQTIADRLARIDSDPTRLQQLEDRMTQVQKLKRKYGPTVATVLDTLDRSRQRLDLLQSRGERAAELARAVEAAQACVQAAAAALTRVRQAAAGRLAKAITAELRDLGFTRAGFGVQQNPCAPRASGADEIAYGLAPNPGEPMRPLQAIASSGEIARVMLAAQAVLARHDRTPVLVFDEIDANIGGEVGHAVGAKLRAVAVTHQVICITHLPQVAVFGHHHAVVSKGEAKRRTVTRITPVADEDRVEEIARMLGGASRTPLARDHARAMLAAAGETTPQETETPCEC